jgi:uncharacterized protein YbjT (DUF2867 family)
MAELLPILVTGAAGRVGGVGGSIVELLRKRGLPVRAMVHHDDDRAAALRAIGADVVVGDLTRAEDFLRALEGVRRVYFGLSVSAQYLVATVTAAALARYLGDIELFVNMSQMTVSQMSATRMTDSSQQRQHWLGEQALDWSGLPVVHLRPTVFLENPFFLAWAAESIAKDGTIRLPFGTGRTSPIAARDVARVAATLLAEPTPPARRIYELTGPKSEDMHAIAAEYSSGLGRTVRYVDVSFDWWRDHVLRAHALPDHLAQHLSTMAQLHAKNRYDRSTHDVETVTGAPAMSVRDWVARRAELFARPTQASEREQHSPLTLFTR